MSAELTAEFLSQVVRQPVRSHRVELIGHFSNDVFRVFLDYADGPGSAPPSLVMKCPRTDGATESGQQFAHETRFYRELADGLPVRTPRLWFGGDDLLLMEDVRGFLPIRWLDGPGGEHAGLALASLARLHAATAGHVSTRDWIPAFGAVELREQLEREYAHDWSRGRDRLGVFGGAFVELGDALLGRVADSLAPLGDPESLLHGDAHFENLAAIDAGGGRIELLFHDWAGLRRGHPAFDVAVFLVMSYPVELRRRHERAAIARHFELLGEAGGPEIADPWLAYRRGVLAWIVRFARFSHGFGESEAGQGAFRMVGQRCTQAAIDLDVHELIA